MVPASHEYIEYVEGTSSKFYLTIDMGNGQSVVGYGKIGSPGQKWATEDTGSLNTKVRKKIKDGYKPVSPPNLTSAAIKKAAETFKQNCGDQLDFKNGRFMRSGGSSTAKPSKPMTMNSSAARSLKAWF